MLASVVVPDSAYFATSAVSVFSIVFPGLPIVALTVYLPSVPVVVTTPALSIDAISLPYVISNVTGIVTVSPYSSTTFSTL